jgi:hypothetical protein
MSTFASWQLHQLVLIDVLRVRYDNVMWQKKQYTYIGTECIVGLCRDLDYSRCV